LKADFNLARWQDDLPIGCNREFQGPDKKLILQKSKAWNKLLHTEDKQRESKRA
jgi:hypothetical protein